MIRKKIYVCAPFSGTEKQMEQNTTKTLYLCRQLYLQGYNPIAPQLYYPRFLYENKPKERRDGLDAGLEWLEQCDEIWVYGNHITDGMRRELWYARAHDIPIKYINKEE